MSPIEVPINSFEQVVDKVNKMLMDVQLQRYHILNGTTDQFYRDMMQQVITDVTLIPVYRGDSATVDPDVDRDDMHDAILAIVQIMAYTFGKDQRSVEKDFCAQIKMFPVEDVRTAARLKESNRLH